MSDTPFAAVSGTAGQLAVPSPEQRVQSAVAIMGAAGPKPEPTQPPTPPPVTPAEAQPAPAPAFKDAVAKMREEREKRAREQAQEAQYVQENRQLKAQLEAMQSGPSFEDDPVGYAQARKWSREQQLMFGQALLYDLAPDKADPNFRIKMFEDKQRREEARKAQEAEEAKTREQHLTARQEFQRYTASMEEAVMAFDAGSYPESEAWYGDDAAGYLRDMLTTASKIADEATRAGTIADLSPQAVAAKLEADMAAKAAARDKRRTARQPSPQAGQPVQRPVQSGLDAEQSVIDTTSSKTLSGGGAPLPPATSDKDRIQRAIAAGFRNR
jgi:hypothetical protein